MTQAFSTSPASPSSATETAIGTYAKVYWQDLSTREDGTPGLDEGGTIAWKFSREEASSVQVFKIAYDSRYGSIPPDGWIGYRSADDFTVRFEPGETEKLVTFKALEVDGYSGLSHRTMPWRFEGKIGIDSSSFMRLHADGSATSIGRFTTRIEEDDLSGVILVTDADDAPGDGFFRGTEGGSMRIKLERLDISTDMTVEIRPPDNWNGFEWSYSGEAAFASVFVSFKAGDDAPIYVDVPMPDNGVHNPSPLLKYSILPVENVTAVLATVANGTYVSRSPIEGGLSFAVTVVDDDPQPVFSIQSSARTAAEGTRAAFEVTRAGDITGLTKVWVKLEGSGPNPASAADFVAAEDGFYDAGRDAYLLTFAQGEKSKTVSLDLVADGLQEGPETLSASIVEIRHGSAAGLPFGSVNLSAVTNATASLSVVDEPASGAIVDGFATVPVTRFYNRDNGGHFLTASAEERDHLLAAMPSMVLEGEGFRSLQAAAPGADAVFRFFDKATGTHFLTASVAEKHAVMANLPSFSYEGVGFHASREGGIGLTEVYRFFNARNGDHHYTASVSEHDAIIKDRPDYVLEGVAFYVAEDSTTRFFG